MRQGADKAPLSERRDDLYETPRQAIETLLRVEKLPLVLWEPAAGRGAISRVLIDAGRLVYATELVPYPGRDEDIETHRDFLMERAAPAGAQAIVTNPPYKLADAFVRHGLALGLPTIVLLRLMAIEGANRADLIDRHCVRIWAGMERLPFMHREGWEGPKHSNSGAPFAWFVFSPEERPHGSPIELRRMSWRGP